MGELDARVTPCKINARSRLYRSQILQVNTRWKALAEIYTMHSFAPFWNRIPKNEENHGGEKILVQSRENRPGEAHRQLQRSTQCSFAPFSNLNFFVKNHHFFASEL